MLAQLFCLVQRGKWTRLTWFEVQNHEEQPCKVVVFEVVYWFPCSQGKSRRVGVKDALSAFPGDKTVLLQTIELADGNIQVTPAAPCG